MIREIIEDDQSDDSIFSNLQVNTKLIYINRSVTRIPGVFIKLQGTKIEHLDLSYNSISNLNGLEGFVMLKELILDNNQLDDLVIFPRILTLKTLSLNKNNITDLVSFVGKVKNTFPNLTFLSLLGNKACPNQLSDRTKDDDDYRRYRCYVLHHLKKLKFLDSNEVTSAERREATVKGGFMLVKKPKILQVEDESDPDDLSNYAPLPRMSREIGDHRGAYATFKFRYANRESEGNRFIVNQDL